jgi:phytoene dehydrogenase-like protein
MYQLVRALETLAREEGVQISTGERVEQVMVESGRAMGVRLASGETIKADVVVLNTDVPTAYQNMLPPSKQASRKWRNSCSALVYLIGYTGKLPQLLHHNVHFSADFERNLQEIFVQKTVPEDPSFYTCLSVRTEPSDAPEGSENLYVLVPVPNRSGQDATSMKNEVLRKVLSRRVQCLARRGLPAERDAVCRFGLDDGLAIVVKCYGKGANTGCAEGGRQTGGGRFHPPQCGCAFSSGIRPCHRATCPRPPRYHLCQSPLLVGRFSVLRAG